MNMTMGKWKQKDSLKVDFNRIGECYFRNFLDNVLIL